MSGFSLFAVSERGISRDDIRERHYVTTTGPEKAIEMVRSKHAYLIGQKLMAKFLMPCSGRYPLEHTYWGKDAEFWRRKAGT
ncbi:MAG: hypothetical protein AAF530_02215 [Pseudomonadota bacterium]